MRRPTSAELKRIRARLLAWFAGNGRIFLWRHIEANAYVQILSELLLQRTRAETVSSRLGDVLALAPNWEALAGVNPESLGQTLAPLGLWRRRAASLRALALELKGRNWNFPDSIAELQKMPGIGQYMANAIYVILTGRPAPYIDVNMARVLERLFGPRRLVDIRYDPDLQAVAHQLVRSKHSKLLNWAILDLAATICKGRNPLCDECPVSRSCDYFKHSAGKRGASRRKRGVTNG